MTETSPPTLRSRAAWTVGCALSLLLLGPWWLEVPVGDVDPSWQIVLHEAFARRMQFGTEIVWTYGPWGFLWNELYHPGTWGWALAVRGAFAVTLWTVLAALGRQLLGGGWRRWLFAFSLLLLPAYSWDSLVYQGCALLWFAWIELPGRRLPALALVALLAVFSLGKFLILLALAVMVFGLALRSVWLGERALGLGLLGTWAAALVVAWLAAGQSMLGVPVYLHTFWEVASGFGGALTARGSWLEVGWFALAAGLLAMVVAVSSDRSRRGLLLLDLATFGIPLGVAWKHSFTRHDTGHVLIGGTLLVGVGLLVHALSRSRGASRGWQGAPLAVAVATTLLLLWSQPVDPLVRTTLPVIKRLPGRAENAAHLIVGDRSPLERAQAHTLSLAAGEPIGEVRGTVDVYPHAQASLLRHADARWVTRPVIQSNTAYTPSLQDLNVAFLRGPGAPETVLFDIDPSEDHHPAEADSLSLLELLARYDVVDPLGRFVTLRRRDAPRPLAVQPGEGRRVAAGDWLELPTPVRRDGALAWLRVEIDGRPWDGIVGAIWKKQLLRLDVRHADGDVQSWHVAPAVARTGLLVSPTLMNRLHFAALVAESSPKTLDRRATAIRLGLERQDDEEVRRGFKVHVDQVTVPHQPGIVLPATTGLLPELRSPPRPKEEHPIWMPGPDGRIVAFAHAPKEFEFVLRAGLADTPRPVARVEYGLLDGAWMGDQPTDGVTFRVRLEFGPRDQVLWEQRLAPATLPVDRGLQIAEFALPPGDWQRRDLAWTHSGRPRLVLETITGPTGASDWSYWGSLTVR